MERLDSSFRFPPADRGDAEVIIKPGVIELDETSLRDYWRVIRRRLWIIALTCFGTTCATALIFLRMDPVYTAEITLLIEATAPQVLNIPAILSEPLWRDDQHDFYKTQYELMKNPTIAASVVRAEGLETNSLFTSEGKEVGLEALIWAEAKGWVRHQGWARWLFPPPPQVQRDMPGEVKPGVIETYSAMLDIRPVPQTRLVKIVFNTPDPELSARLANAHAQAYIRQRAELHKGVNDEAGRFLEEQRGELKRRLEKSEAVLNRYRRARKILSLNEKENTVIERLADLNKRLTEAEAERITLEAQVRLIRNRDYNSLPPVINSPLIGQLKQQLTHLEGEYASLTPQLKASHPRMEKMRSQIAESQGRLRQEIRSVVEGSESAYLAAKAKEHELRAKMEQQKAAAHALKDAAVEYAILAREVDTNRQLYENVLQRMKETGVAADLRASNVFPIGKAIPPHRPSTRLNRQSLLLSALVGLMGGVGLVFLCEYLDNTFKTPKEVQRYLRLPNLGMIPDFVSGNGRRYIPRKLPYTPLQLPSPLSSGKEARLVPSYYSFGVVTEAYRTLRAAILLSRSAESPKTILFTSGLDGEGKTVTVVNTAIVFAQMGVPVLVIDADLRRPNCHRVLEMENGPGLTEVLTGQSGPMEVIRPTATLHLALLSAGSLHPRLAELVGSTKMRRTIVSLQQHYDYILIDSPPVMQVSDAMLVSTMVDGVVLVVNSQETPKNVVKEACARLGYAQAEILGVMLNRVNLRSGDYAYYYRSRTS